MNNAQRKPRRWWIAVPLLICAPVAALYVGAPLLALSALLMTAVNVLVFNVGITGWFANTGFVLSLASFQAAFILAFVVVTIWKAIRGRHYVLKWWNHWSVYTATAVLMGMLTAYPELTGDETIKVKTYHLDFASMVPSIAPGDHFLADQRPSVADRVAAGDVITWHPSHRDRFPYIHRIIGVPGDQVRLVNGVPEINGTLLNQTPLSEQDAAKVGAPADLEIWRETLPNGRSYLVTRKPELAPNANTQIVTLGEDQFFVLGDNRENSIDSRTHRPRGLGLANRSEILGVVTGFYWSKDPGKIGAPVNAFSD
ncbi:MAG: signal peptidase I [Pseudomonadota bacterium]